MRPLDDTMGTCGIPKPRDGTPFALLSTLYQLKGVSEAQTRLMYCVVSVSTRNDVGSGILK